MPKTKNFSVLRDQVMARPGGRERVAELRQELVAAIGLNKLRRRHDLTQTDFADPQDQADDGL